LLDYSVRGHHWHHRGEWPVPLPRPAGRAQSRSRRHCRRRERGSVPGSRAGGSGGWYRTSEPNTAIPARTDALLVHRINTSRLIQINAFCCLSLQSAPSAEHAAVLLGSTARTALRCFAARLDEQRAIAPRGAARPSGATGRVQGGSDLPVGKGMLPTHRLTPCWCWKFQSVK